MTTPPENDDRDDQIAALLEIVETLTDDLRRLQDDVDQLADRPAPQPAIDHAQPAPWVWYLPPAAAEDDPDNGEDPRFTVDNFIAWYNLTFTGIDGSRAHPIPACWHHHPALAMETATLAYTWRAANIGPTANPRDAQHWLHQWRPGYTDRLTRDWTHPDCLDGRHHGTAVPSRANRHDLECRRFTPNSNRSHGSRNP